MIVAAGPDVLAIADGIPLILDADAGILHVKPDAAALEVAQTELADRRLRGSAARATAHNPGIVADGRRIEIFGNIGSVEDAHDAVANGAEGCGLLRTEFLFLDREQAPSEDEQAHQYQHIAKLLEGRPMIVRTLDIGGDKAVRYLPILNEENPALGMRGVRVSLSLPQLLKSQLRAILRVQPIGQCKIMIPMVANLEELRAVRAILSQASAELGIVEPLALGVMIETPAAAVNRRRSANRRDRSSFDQRGVEHDVTVGAVWLFDPADNKIDGLHRHCLQRHVDCCKGRRA